MTIDEADDACRQQFLPKYGTPDLRLAFLSQRVATPTKMHIWSTFTSFLTSVDKTAYYLRTTRSRIHANIP